MARQIVVVTWQDSAQVYQEYSQLKHANIAGIHQAAIVERGTDGKIVIKEGDSAHIGALAIDGGLIGLIIGILAGPLGMLLGFSTGALFGAILDLNHAHKDSSTLAQISAKFPINRTGIVIDIEESDETLVNAYFAAKGGSIQRWSYAEVQAEVEASVVAWEAVNLQVDSILREQKKAEHAEKRKKKWEEFKAKHHL